MPNKSAAKGLFIIGTDTGVGKTSIAATLARCLVARGLDCGVMKPIETGCVSESQSLIPKDGAYLKAAARTEDALSLITPCRYRAPLSPYAASLQGEPPLDKVALLAAFQKLQGRHRVTILEGLGGLVVPLSDRESLIDLVKEIGFPVLLVARSGLGTLNHSLLTLRWGRAQGIFFSGLILKRTSPRPPDSEKTNLRILTERSGLPVMGPFPYLAPRPDREDWLEESCSCFEGNAVMRAFLDTLTVGEKPLP